MTQKNNIIIAAVSLTAVLVVIIGFIAFSLHRPHDIAGSESLTIKIETGDSLNRITQKLQRVNAINSGFLFKWYGVLSGQSKQFKVGHYTFNGPISMKSVMEILIKGQATLLQTTIPEGLRMTEVFSLLQKRGYTNSGNYIQAAADKSFITALRLPFDTHSLEGFIFPETYKFDRNLSEKSLITEMVKTFKRKIPKDYRQRAEKVGLTGYEAVILASIIEKETGAASERRIISSVFHNRLKKKMLLQTDPTVIYGIANFNGNLTRKQLRQKTPYNTYVIRGLPPTPIANPGMDSLMAAVDPANTPYLYFVAMGDGRHKFSSNYRSHVNAVRKYQKRRRKNYRSY